MAAEKSKKDRSTMIFIVVVLLLTLVGAGTGLAVGSLMQSDAGHGDEKAAAAESQAEKPKAEAHAAADAEAGHGAEAAKEGHGEAAGAEAEEEEADEEPEPGSVKVVAFPPVLTTLAEPKGKWIRVEGSILVSAESHDPPELLAEKSGEYILAYLRTLRLDQIEGPAGILGLREDLNEMIKVTTHGEARGVLIHGLIVE